VARLWISLPSVMLLALGWIQTQRLQPSRTIGILSITPATPYIHYMPSKEPRSRVLVVHGLNSNKEFMQILCAALTDSGFEVFSIDLPGHGNSPAKFEASLAQHAVLNTLEHLGDSTIVLGHSLGAGLLLDLAVDRHFKTMVLLSPPPTPVPRIRADRILVVTGRWDMPRINSFVPVLEEADVPELQRWEFPWGAHSTAVLNPSNVHDIIEWIGGDVGHIRAVPRLGWITLMIGSAFTLGLSLLPGRGIPRAAVPISPILVRYVAAGGIALLVLKAVPVMGWLRVFALDYLMGFVLVMGVALWFLFGEGGGDRQTATRLLKPLVAAAFVIVVLFQIVGSHLFHVTLSSGRWWRFPAIALASLPLFFTEETLIRRIAPWWKSVLVALLTRILLAAFLVTGVLLLNRGDAFLVLVIHVVVSFWIALWLVTEAVYRHTHSPFAAALFSSFVQGWAFAAACVIV
jgi:pimeloyl-ACP methyl ester carboxylesterase